MTIDVKSLDAGVIERTGDGDLGGGGPDQSAIMAANIAYSSDNQVTFRGDKDDKFIDNRVGMARDMYEPEPEEYSAGEKLKAFFETENTLASALAETDYEQGYEYGYNSLQDHRTKAYPHLARQFLNSASPNETMAIIANNERESFNREVIASTSTLGTFGYSALAMTLDPVLLPAMLYTGGVSFMARIGAKGTALLWGATAGSSEIVAEIMKHDSQRMRTPQESFFAVAGATLFTALGGGLMGAITQKQFKTATTKAAKDIFESSLHGGHVTARKDYIASLVKNDKKFAKEVDAAGKTDTSVGAMESVAWWQKRIPNAWKYQLKETGIGIEKWRTNPLVRLSQSRVPLARVLAPMLADSPFYYKGTDHNLSVTGAQGSIESQKRKWVGDYLNTMTEVESIYLKSRGLDGALGSTKALWRDTRGATKEAGEMPWNTFKEEVSMTLRRGGKSDNEAVAEAAKTVREKLLNPIMEEGIRADVFDRDIINYADTYFPRLWDFDKINAESHKTSGGLTDIINNWLLKEQTPYQNKKLSYTEHLDGLRKQVIEAEEGLRDLKEAGIYVKNESKYIKDEVLKFNVDPDTPREVGQALGLKSTPLTISTFLRDQGGIRKDIGGEVAQREITNEKLVGIRADNGLNIEHSIERLWEVGYYDEFVSWHDIPHSRFLDDLAEDLDGSKIYTGQIREDMMPIRAIKENTAMQQFLYAHKLSRESQLPEIRAALAKEQGIYGEAAKGKTLRKNLKELRKSVRGTEDKIDEYADFASFTPVEVRNLAEEIVNNIRGLKVNQFDENLLPDTSAFRAGSLKDRKLTISDLEIEEYLVSNLDDVMSYYTKSVTPQMLVAKEFGDLQMDNVLTQVRAQFDTIKATTEKRMTKQGKSREAIDKALQKIEKEAGKDAGDLIALRDKLYGQYNRPVDPENAWYKAGETIKALNFMRLLGQMTISAIPDLARPVMVHGLKPVLGTLMALQKSPGLYKAALADVKASGVAIESMSNLTVNRFGDLTEYAGKRTKFEKGIETATSGFAKLTLMPMWNDTLKGFSGLVTQDAMAKAIMTGNTTKRQLRELAKQGIGADDLDAFAKLLNKYGEDHNGMFVPNANKWEDIIEVTPNQFPGRPDVVRVVVDGKAMQSLWRSSLSKTINEIIVTPGIGEMPLWVSSPAGSIITQFKSFAMSAHSRVLVSGLQARDAQALEGLLFGLLMGSLVIETKAAINGRDTPDNPGDYIYDALDRTGFMGWLNEPIQMSAKVTGGMTAPGQLWGSERANVSKYASRNILGAMLGPSTDLIGDLSAVSAALASGEWSDGDTNTARKLLPAQNLFYFSWLLSHLKD